MGDVLIITENPKSFVVRSLETALVNVHLKNYVLSVRDEISDDVIKDTSLMVLVGSDEFKQSVFVLQAIKNKCIECDRRVAVFGMPEENEFIIEHLGDDAVIKEFVRPMPPADLADGIKKICESEKRRQTKSNILVVDDSGMTLRTMMEWLEDSYAVQVANSALKATPIIEKNTPDLILLDYEMPECSGANFFRILKEREETKHIPVIFLTSRDDASTVNEVIALKPAGYVLKTVSKEMLLQRIEEVLSR